MIFTQTSKILHMDICILYESDRVSKAIDKAIDDRFSSQKAAAKAIGVANSTLSRYKQLGRYGKNRRRIPSLKALAKLRKVLGMKAYKAVLSAINMEVNPPKRKKK